MLTPEGIIARQAQIARRDAIRAEKAAEAAEYAASRPPLVFATTPAPAWHATCTHDECDNHGRCYDCGGYNASADLGRFFR